MYQDVSVDEAEIKSKYDSGTLTKVNLVVDMFAKH